MENAHLLYDQVPFDYDLSLIIVTRFHEVVELAPVLGKHCKNSGLCFLFIASFLRPELVLIFPVNQLLKRVSEVHFGHLIVRGNIQSAKEYAQFPRILQNILPEDYELARFFIARGKVHNELLKLLDGDEACCTRVILLPDLLIIVQSVRLNG